MIQLFPSLSDVDFGKFNSPFLFKDIPVDAEFTVKAVFSAGIMEGYCDQTFHPDQPLTYGELIFDWIKLIKFIQKTPKPPIFISSDQTAIAGLSKGNWMYKDLQLLATIGAFPESFPPDFDFNRPATDNDLEALSQTTLAFFKRFLENSSASKTELEPLSTSEGKNREVGNDQFVQKAKIVDCLSHKPIPNAQVVVGGKLFRSDESGSFSFSNLKRDEIAEVLVTADDYESLSVRHKAGFKEGEITFFLKPYKASLKGQVISSASGEPIEGVVASFCNQIYTTDKQGKFSLRNSKPGYHQIEFSASGYQTAKELVFIEEGPTIRTFRLHPAL